MTPQQCSYCRSEDLWLYDMIDLTCRNCGTVVEDYRIQDLPEYRNYDDGVDRNHYGSVPTLKETITGKRKLETTTHTQGKAARTCAAASHDQALEKNLQDMRKRIAELRPMHDNDPVQEKAAAYFVKDWTVRNGKRGVSNKYIMAACLYIATRRKHNLSQITTHFDAPLKNINCAIKQLLENGAVTSRDHIQALSKQGNEYVQDIQDMSPNLSRCEKMQIGRTCEDIDEAAIRAGVRGSKNTSIYKKAVVLVALEEKGMDVDNQLLKLVANLNSKETIKEHARQIKKCREKVAVVTHDHYNHVK